MQVDLEDRLEQSHIGALVQTHLVLPDVDNEHLTSRKRKESTLALKVLILATFAAVSTFHVHNQDVIRHALAGAFLTLLLILLKPDTLRRLPPLQLRHDRELRAEEVVQQGGLSGRLGAEHGDEMVVEAGGRDIFDTEVLGEIRTASCEQ